MLNLGVRLVDGSEFGSFQVDIDSKFEVSESGREYALDRMTPYPYTYTKKLYIARDKQLDSVPTCAGRTLFKPGSKNFTGGVARDLTG
jgi:hypothetical protein